MIFGDNNQHTLDGVVLGLSTAVSCARGMGTSNRFFGSGPICLLRFLRRVNCLYDHGDALVGRTNRGLRTRAFGNHNLVYKKLVFP